MKYWQEQLLRAWLLSKREGFSLLEVLVAIIVITVFTITTMQALVIATAFRVRAEQSSGANNWIQEHIEEAKFEASELPEDQSLCDAKTKDEGYASELDEALPLVEENDEQDIIDKNNEEVIFTGFYLDDADDRIKTDYPGQELWLLRNTNITDDDPHVLELEYVVVLDDNGDPSNDEKDIVVQTYTEVIPDEAFNC